MVTYLLEYCIVAEGVMLELQARKGLTGLFVIPSFSNCLGKPPVCLCATAWEPWGTCLPGNSLLPVVSLRDLKDCLGLISSLITLFNP